VISRFPLENIENLFLKKDETDKEFRLLQNFSISLEGKHISFSNIHFSNSDAWAEKHLQQTLNLFSTRNEQRIIIGDFNIKDLGSYRNLYSEQYQCSNDNFIYYSYPQKEETLDYVLLPKEFQFSKFECLDRNISDHSPLYFEIQ